MRSLPQLVTVNGYVANLILVLVVFVSLNALLLILSYAVRLLPEAKSGVLFLVLC